MISFKNSRLDSLKAKIKSSVNNILFSPANLERLNKLVEGKIDRIIEQKIADIFAQNFTTLVQNEPSLIGKFFSAQKDLNYYVQENPQSSSPTNDGLPIPPWHLREGYGNSDATYLEWGKQHIDNMVGILAKDGFEFTEGQSIMEFGCAAGRMLRWLVDRSNHSELWGCDLSAEHILWCQQNLSPPFNFLTTTAAPSLPFSDCYFDLIYAGSVFTHIGELTDAWLLELKRILKPSGRLYITVHDQNTIRILQEQPDRALAQLLREWDAKVKLTSTNFEVFYINSSPRGGQILQVFYNNDYLKQKLSRLYALKSVNEEAYGYQTAILLQKR
ncbi:class I SAM-dependent methyltransferase [Pseudanabaena sp. PCC 6802]|uniref:class I SAM-dependent methyltransferase n=1 Tax=Pseudanabaena sp. PCC 6802 TaxID=118173 RepID=UPI0003485316|nr:class I SAM-dependent methyltransferase [Pseudanabaena sp. PCC 6802]